MALHPNLHPRRLISAIAEQTIVRSSDDGTRIALLARIGQPT
jgi:hypothetical protein